MNECKINDVELYDNSWRRWFMIKVLNLARYFKLYAPYLFYMIIGYAGSRTANILFDKYLADRINCIN
jgi:hypothetical protein